MRDAERADRPFLSVERAGHRLTGDLADWYQLDPARLDESLEGYHERTLEQYGVLSRMVNRNDATVPHVFVGGHEVWRERSPTDLLGSVGAGRFLRAGERSTASRRADRVSR